jgi:hypothetical protein
MLSQTLSQGQLRQGQGLATAPTVQTPAAKTHERDFQVHEMIAKHKKILASIKEQEKQWTVASNAGIFFDIMNETGDGKCSFRDLVLWVRRNYHELHRLPVLLHAFEATAGATMSSDVHVTRLQFPQLLSAILQASRVWVLFDCLASEKVASKGSEKLLSESRFAQGMTQLCDDMGADSIQEHWQRLCGLSIDQQHSVTFTVFCSWMTSLDHGTQQQMLAFCAQLHDNDARSDLPAVYVLFSPIVFA